MAELLNVKSLFCFFLCCSLVNWFGCSGNKYCESGKVYDEVDMIIGYGNKNGCRLGVILVLQEYF